MSAYLILPILLRVVQQKQYIIQGGQMEITALVKS